MSKGASKQQMDSGVVRLPHFIHAGHFAHERTVDYHSHLGSELVLITEGSCRMDAGGKWLKGAAGTLFLLPVGVPHCQLNNGFVRTSFMSFIIAPALLIDDARTIEIGLDDPLVVWIEHLCALFVSGATLGQELGGGLILACAGRINEIEQRLRDRESLHPAVARAAAYLDERSDQGVSLTELAHAVGLSASHLKALFRKQMGVSPHRYSLTLRIERARRLLQNPEARVNEVAAACGFEDANYFIRLFRHHCGSPPGLWRREGQMTEKRRYLSS